MPRLLIALTFSMLTTTATAGGYIGLGSSFNNTNDFDHENDGLRIDLGAKTHPNLDLEWNYIDLGESLYNDPTFVPGNTDDDDEDNDLATFSETRFGTVNRRAGAYAGFSRVHVEGIAAGIKWHAGLAKTVRVFARTSLLAWKGETTELEIYGPREGLDADGDPLPNGADPNDAVNKNPCGNLNFCRIEREGKTFWAVNYWMGAGLIYNPFNWLSFRGETSVTTLKATEFPQVTYESLGITMELHF